MPSAVATARAADRPAPLRFLVLLCAIAAFLPLITDAYLPAIRPIMAQYQADVHQVQLTMSLALIGFAVSQLFMGLMADRVGRKPVLLTGIALFTLGSALAAVASSLTMLIVCRVLQGVGAAAGPVLSRAIVRDSYERFQASRVLSFVGIGLAIVPLFAPILNSHLVSSMGWRYVFIVFVVYGVLIAAATIRWLPETLAARDLDALSGRRILAALRGLFDNTACLGYVLCCVAGYSGLFIFVSSSPHVIIRHFGVAPDHFGYYFAVPVLGYMSGSLVSMLSLGRYTPDTLLRAGVTALVVAGALLTTSALLGIDNVYVFVGLFALFNGSWALLQPQAQASALAYHPELAGRTSALLGFLQMLAAAVAGALFGFLHDGTTGPASYLTLGAALLCALSLFVLVEPNRN